MSKAQEREAQLEKVRLAISELKEGATRSSANIQSASEEWSGFLLTFGETL